MKAISELNPVEFHYSPMLTDSTKPGLLFLFGTNRTIFLEELSDEYFIPEKTEIVLREEPLFFGELSDFNCFAAIYPEAEDVDELTAFQYRDILEQFDDSFYPMLSRAFKLCHWNSRTRFCGQCGHRTETVGKEIARKCPECGEMYFPVIAPATITAIIKNKQILLAANRNFKPGLYSIIAGFVEAGESIEDCVRREIQEEVGIKIKNIRYFGSQAWPFPNSLMLGFIADYDSGEINPDGNEIIDAQWFDIDKLPDLPSRVSIARKIIDSVVETLKGN